MLIDSTLCLRILAKQATILKLPATSADATIRCAAFFLFLLSFLGISGLIMSDMVQAFFTMDQFPDPIGVWVNDLFVWVGFGTVVGLLAKMIMPGRDPGGVLATIAMGIGGTIIGSGTCSLLMDGQRITPVSPAGLCVGTLGAFTLLFFYRLLGGYWFLEGEEPVRRLYRRRRRGRHRYSNSYDD
jgi:uncharacterized membrane protein YeaQ/YmgE (transglycosylase-associated protein family)